MSSPCCWPGARLVLADWLDERGVEHDLSRALRWMAARGKAPHERTHYPIPGRPAGWTLGRRVPARFRFAWYREARPSWWVTVNRIPGESRLPALVMAAGVNNDLGADQKVFPTWEAAARWLATAIKRLRDLSE